MTTEETGTALEKYLEQPEPELVAREATNERSPNRQPRLRLSQREQERWHRQRMFLRLYKVTGELKLTCERAKVVPATAAAWAANDPAFRDAYMEIKAMWQEINEEHLDALDGAAIDTVEFAITQRKDPRLAFEASQKHLRGRGKYSDRNRPGQGDAKGGSTVIVAVVVREPKEE